MRLLHMDPPIIMNVKKIRRLMKKYNLFCPIRKANPYRRMAKALKTNNVADNLLNREFKLHGPRAILLTDITYLPYNGTKCYLSTILDAYASNPKGPHESIHIAVNSDSKSAHIIDTTNGSTEHTI